MTDVVDSDELLRRIRRARDWAGQEERAWRTKSRDLKGHDPDEAVRAETFGTAFEAVRKVLDQIVSPGAAD